MNPTPQPEPVRKLDAAMCEALAECFIEIAKSRGFHNIESQRAKLIEIAEAGKGQCLS